MKRDYTSFLNPRVGIRSKKKGVVSTKYRSLAKPPKGVKRPGKKERKLGKVSSALSIGGLGGALSTYVAAGYFSATGARVKGDVAWVREKFTEVYLKKAKNHPQIVKLQRELDNAARAAGRPPQSILRGLSTDPKFRASIDTAIVKDPKYAKLVRQSKRFVRSYKIMIKSTPITVAATLGGIALAYKTGKITRKRFKKGGYNYDRTARRFEKSGRR